MCSNQLFIPLSPIDKLTYLKSVLDSAAAEAIAGLTLTAANYEEAISTLKKRFGNKQLIIMEILLAVSHQHNLKVTSMIPLSQMYVD